MHYEIRGICENHVEDALQVSIQRVVMYVFDREADMELKVRMAKEMAETYLLGVHLMWMKVDSNHEMAQEDYGEEINNMINRNEDQIAYMIDEFEAEYYSQQDTENRPQLE